LPVAGKDKEGYCQTDPNTEQNVKPGAKTPRGIVPDHIHGHTVYPTQEHTDKNADEDLSFRRRIFLLGGQLKPDRAAKIKRIHLNLL